MAELRDVITSGDVDIELMESIGLPNADNTSDLDKPISTATQAALDLKATTDPAGITGASSVTNFLSISDVDYQALGVGRPVNHIYFTELAIYKGDIKIIESAAANNYSDYMNSLPGLEAYWRLGDLSGTVATEEVSANNGIYNGSPTLGVAGLISGDTDTAISLNGTSQYVWISRSLFDSIGTGDFAIIINTNASGTDFIREIIAWDSPSTTADELRLYIQANIPRFQIYDLNTATLVRVVGDASIQGINANIVAQRRSGMLELFVNGVQQTETFDASTINLDQTLLDANIGRHPNGFNHFTGVIDDVAILSTPLSPAQVTELHNFSAGI